MTADINRWVLDNLYLIPFMFVLLVIGLHQEKRRIDRRIDAVIELLKRRGIDIYQSLDDF